MALITAAAAGGNWTAGATWVGGVAPSAADDALLTATSGNVTVNSGAVCRSLNCTGYTGVLTHTAGVTLTIGDATAGAGNAAVKLSGTYTLGDAATSAIAFVSTSTTVQTVNFGGLTTGNVTFNGAGGKWQLATNGILTGSTATVTLTTGTLDFNGLTCNFGVFSSPSGTRTITFGAAQITVTGASVVISAGAPTITANTATITLTAANAIFAGTVNTFAGTSVVFTGGGLCLFSGAGMANLTFTGTASKGDTLQMPTVAATTLTGTLTVTGQSATNRVLVSSNLLGSAKTFSAAARSLSNVDWMDVTAAGAASPLTGTSMGDAGGNTNITFDAAVTRFAVVAGNWSATATWSASSGGAGGASVPLPQDTVTFDAASAAGTYTVDMPRLGKDVSLAGFTRTLDFALAATLYGSLTLGAGMTITGTAVTTLGARASKTLTSNGRTLTQGITVAAPTGTITLADALNTAGALLHTAGTLDSAGVTVTASTVTSSGTLTRALTLGASTWDLTSTAAVTVWNLSGSGLTVSAASGTVVVSTVSASTRTFTGKGATYGTLSYTVAGSTGGLTVSDANTFGTLAFSDASNARTLTLPAGLTTTVTSAFTVNGTSGALMSVISSAAGTAATLSKSSGTVICSYLSLKDSAATGGATFYAANSTNVSGNSGWIFAVVLAATGTGSGLAPAPSVTAGAGVSAVAATGSGLAPVPTVTGTASLTAALAVGSALAPVPGVTGSASAAAPAATASGLAPVPLVSAGDAQTAPPAVGQALMPPPTVGAGATVSAVAASGSGLAPVPAVTITTAVLAPPAAGSATAPAPTVRVTFTATPPAAHASGLAPVPLLRLTVNAPTAHATAGALAPTIGGTRACAARTRVACDTGGSTARASAAFAGSSARVGCE